MMEGTPAFPPQTDAAMPPPVQPSLFPNADRPTAAARPRGKEPPAVDGFRFLPDHLDMAAQRALVALVGTIAEAAPFDRFAMPGTGHGFSIDMTNAGPLGWVADRQSYRYSATHLRTGRPWPPIPEALVALWRDLTAYPADPECCLINLYRGIGARLGLHRDEDEETFDAPIVNVSLGDTAVFRLGGLQRRDPTRSFRVTSGTVMVFGGQSRVRYHGVDRIIPGSGPVCDGADLVPGGGRLNLTLRRVTRPG